VSKYKSAVIHQLAKKGSSWRYPTERTTVCGRIVHNMKVNAIPWARVGDATCRECLGLANGWQLKSVPLVLPDCMPVIKVVDLGD
jgi:hypothetical protein